MYEEEYPSREEVKRFWGKVLRTFLAMLFYGGIATVVGIAVVFVLNFVVEYFYWKQEVVEYIGMALTVVLFPLLFGFKHVENCGYIDSYDEDFSYKKFMKQLAVSTALVMIIPMMIAANINFLVVFIYKACYGPSDCISELISEAFFHQYDGTTNLGIAIGTAVTYIGYFLLALPFYKLGKEHHERDVENGENIKIT